MSADPAGPVDGPNLYAYVSGNPVRMNDPGGTQEQGGYYDEDNEMCMVGPRPQSKTDGISPEGNAAQNEPATPFIQSLARLGARGLLQQQGGLYRGLHPDDMIGFQNGEGLSPVSGTKPSPPDSIAEGTYRHTRPGGNARIKGSDRISWTTNIEDAAAIAEKRGTPVVKLKDGTSVSIRTTEQLLGDLDEWKKQLESKLANAKGKNKIDKLKGSLAALDDAVGYVKKYGEHHTGPVPATDLSPTSLRGEKLAGAAGKVMLGLSILLSAKRVMDAEPERRSAVLTDEVAAFAMDAILPGAGPLGAYATQTARGELKPFSIVFPTAYSWILDAYVGDALEQADPEGSRIIRQSVGDDEKMIDMWYGIFGISF